MIPPPAIAAANTSSPLLKTITGASIPEIRSRATVAMTGNAAVAEILAYVYQLTGKKLPGQAA